MNTDAWFKEFLESYRAIIDSRFSDKKDLFPYYEPVDTTIYHVDDPRRIIPEVVVFFEKATDVTAVSGLILSDNKKIRWPRDFDELSTGEQDMSKDIIYYESFPENGYHGFFVQEVFSEDIFKSQPIDQAEIMVQKQLVEGLQRASFKDFLKTAEIRKKQLGNKGKTCLLSNISQMPDMNDEQKADVISLVFYLLGFETINLERMKHLDEYGQLRQVGHVDVLAFLVEHRILVMIEEGEMNKDRWYKKDTLAKSLDILKFLGHKTDWRTIIFLAIGRKSSGIDHLEGNVRVVSADFFASIVQKTLEGKREFAILGAIEKLLGYKLRFFWR